jgi:hypothetical protein
VASKSSFQLATELTSYLNTIVARYDIDDLRPAERTALVQVKHQAIDARLEARDYDYADTRAEQQQAAKAARQYFEQLEQSVLKASEYDLISSIEVALVSANIQKIISLLA